MARNFPDKPRVIYAVKILCCMIAKIHFRGGSRPYLTPSPVRPITLYHTIQFTGHMYPAVKEGHEGSFDERHDIPE
jgi:hypothetical protein